MTTHTIHHNVMQVDSSGNEVQTDGSAAAVGGYTVESRCTAFTRPSNTTAYAVGQVVSNTGTAAVRTFAGCARANGGSGYVVKVIVQSNAVDTGAQHRLHLYKTAITAIADAATNTVDPANTANYIGAVDLPVVTSDGTNSYALSLQAPLEFVCATGDTALYGVLEARAAFTPGTAKVYNIQLGIEQN